MHYINNNKMACSLCTGLSFIFIAFLILKIFEWFWRKRRMSSKDLAEKYVFVTGCDTGFGNRLVKRLDKNTRINVFAGCLTERGRAELDGATSDRVTVMSLDVTNHESVQGCFTEVKKRLPQGKGLWGLVNNAGIIGFSGPMDWVDGKYCERVIKVNLIGVIDVTLTFLPLIYAGRGRIVNIASAYGRFPFPVAGYSESKFGVEAFSDSLRFHLRSIGSPCGVSILEPGFFRTNLNDPAKLTEDINKVFKEMRPEMKEFYHGVDDEYIKRLVTENNEFMDLVSTPNIDLVVDAYEHALTSKWPKKRYSIHWDAKMLWIPMSYMPSWLQDFIIAMLCKRKV